MERKNQQHQTKTTKGRDKRNPKLVNKSTKPKTYKQSNEIQNV